jgi:hypothetical protein
MDKTPKHHGEFYFEPNPAQWKTAVLQNREKFSNKALWGQTPSQVRALLKMQTDCPIVLSGHQPIFFYPGIWAKCLAASQLAQSVSGVAYHKITDTALAPEFIHSIPEIEKDGRARRREIDFFISKDMKTREKAVPYAFLPAPDKAALEKIFSDAVTYGPASVQKSVKYFGEKLIESLKVNTAWNQFHVSTLHLLDHITGTKRFILEGSALWTSEPFLNFLIYWLTHLAELTGSYNDSLNEYRKKNGITHEIEPMPNLKFEDWYFELPFWGTSKAQHRDTLWAKTEGKVISLKVKGVDGQYKFHLDNLKNELTLSSLKIWPKAIPQSLFLRMYLCDFFIHGIGGGVYEEVGDLFFQKTIQALPPVYGVISATYLVDFKESEKLDLIVDREKALESWKRILEQNPEYLFTRQADWKKDLPSFIHTFIENCLKNMTLKRMASEKIDLLTVLKDPVRRPEAAKKIKELNSLLFEGYGNVLTAIEEGRLEIETVKVTRDALSYREYPFFCFEESLFLDMKEKISRALVEGWK